jgi:oxygen-dependent protoporphyrinogen oxidase
MTVGIVGGGITGLALTHYLRERGVECLTFEASDQPGGVIRTGEVDGRVLEWGPQRLRVSETVAELIADVGIEDELLTVPEDLPLYVYADGRLRRVPFSFGEFLRTDLLSWRGKLRLLGEPLTDAGDPEETVAELVTRKFGRETYENLVGPLFGGIYGSDPAEMPAKYSLETILEVEQRSGSLLTSAVKKMSDGSDRPPAASFEDGMQRLPEAVYEANAEHVNLGTPVVGIEADGDGYRLGTDDEGVRVDEVVVTTQADTAARLLDGIAGGVDALSELNYNPLAMVHLESDCDREAMGFQIRDDEPFDLLGVSFNDAMFDRDGVYTCFLGGMNNPDHLEEADERLGTIAAEEFESILGASAEVLSVERLPDGFPAHDDSWAALDRVDLPEDVHLMTNYTARMGVPSRIRQAKSMAAEFDAAADVDRRRRPATAD